ncbi:MAG TPA: DUF4845 domain-containing protein [Tahibacter sp.]|uniref:DUF4845 domain-containing protein n=1 Tax=Tahibacter sp. TaxID=2056211 RepID=UPI002B69C85C|nr:DUF4845 domain-containing protein [Tahibacter sp.]HSX59945.1 DUF4845 domain-containing protein [Tahibacter sp.]
MKQSQRGITFIGFVVVLIIGGFFAYAAMKLVPVYTEYMGVVKSMNQLLTEPGITSKDVGEIRQMLNTKFSIQYVDDATVPPQNIQLNKRSGAASLRVFYDKRIDFIYNVDLLVSFDKTLDLTGTGAAVD